MPDTGKEAANAWSVTYVMTERNGAWVLLDDTLDGLGMRRAPEWCPGARSTTRTGRSR